MHRFGTPDEMFGTVFVIAIRCLQIYYRVVLPVEWSYSAFGGIQAIEKTARVRTVFSLRERNIGDCKKFVCFNHVFP
jgi:hypothetical protein